MKFAVSHSQASYDPLQAGNQAIYDLFDLTSYMGNLVQDKEEAKVHSAKIKVQVGFTAASAITTYGDVTLLVYTTDGAPLAYYRPSGPVYQIDDLIDNFADTGKDMSFKLLSEPVMMIPRAAFGNGTTNRVISTAIITGNLDKYAREAAKLLNDPLYTTDIRIGVALIVRGASGEVPVVSYNVLFKYDVQDRPLRTIMRRNI